LCRYTYYSTQGQDLKICTNQYRIETQSEMDIISHSSRFEIIFDGSECTSRYLPSELSKLSKSSSRYAPPIRRSDPPAVPGRQAAVYELHVVRLVNDILSSPYKLYHSIFVVKFSCQNATEKNVKIGVNYEKIYGNNFSHIVWWIPGIYCLPR